MNIHIIGAGITGLSSALALARAGCTVTVLESHAGVAQGSSFAPGGLLSTLTPELWLTQPSWSLARRSRTSGFPQMTLPFWPSRSKRWAKARQRSHAQTRSGLDLVQAANDSPPQPLSSHPHAIDLQALTRLAAELQLDHEYHSGHLIVARKPSQVKSLQRMLAWLQLRQAPNSAPTRWLNEEELHTLEPALNPDSRAMGAIYLPQDMVGNCRQMAMAMRDQALRLGVEFRINSHVERLRPTSQGAAGWQLQLRNGQHLQASHVVLCAGEAARDLLRPLGERLPLQAAHGYTLSAQIREPINAPQVAAVTDAAQQICISRQGQRIRVMGAYRLGVAPSRHDKRAVETLYQGLTQWYPGAAVLDDRRQIWSSTVWMTADDQPLIGAVSRQPGLWLNTGHGFRGWALCQGAAQQLLALLSDEARSSQSADARVQSNHDSSLANA